MSASIRTYRIDSVPAPAREALAHHETILSADLTVRLINAIGPFGCGSFVKPEVDLTQGFADRVKASTVRAAAARVGLNVGEDLGKLMAAAEEHGFLLCVDCYFSNKSGGAIFRIVEDDEW